MANQRPNRVHGTSCSCKGCKYYRDLRKDAPTPVPDTRPRTRIGAIMPGNAGRRPDPIGKPRDCSVGNTAWWA